MNYKTLDQWAKENSDLLEICAYCYGTGKDDNEVCPECDGKGFYDSLEKLYNTQKHKDTLMLNKWEYA
jgi:DnaJ-class molecular chaperone